MIREKFNNLIEAAKYLTGVNQQDFDNLKEVTPYAAIWAKELVDNFYNVLFANHQIVGLFKSQERVVREHTLIQWYLNIFNVNDEKKFWLEQVRIGIAHIRRHINNEWMVAITARFLEIFSRRAITTFGAEKGIELIISFNKILQTTTAITVGVYDMLLAEATGASEKLIDNLISSSLDDILNK